MRRILPAMFMAAALVCAGCGNPVYQEADSGGGDSGPRLESITIDSPPAKQVYEYGEDLDISGLKVTGTWEDGDTGSVDVDRGNISGYYPYVEGVQTCTITIEGATAAFDVTVRYFIALEGWPAAAPGATLTCTIPVVEDSVYWTVVWHTEKGEAVEPQPASVPAADKQSCVITAPAAAGKYQLVVSVLRGSTAYSRTFNTLVQ